MTNEPQERREIIREAVAEYDREPGPVHDPLLWRVNLALRAAGDPDATPGELEAVMLGQSGTEARGNRKAGVEGPTIRGWNRRGRRPATTERGLAWFGREQAYYR